MFKTYRHAELSPAAIFGEPYTRHWKFIELELHHPWFYVELVRDHGDDIVGSMLMIPTVPILQQGEPAEFGKNRTLTVQASRPRLTVAC
ncbi:hypothetical protein LH705_23810 [Pseudomonas putida]|uniref:hypothetical protein n=1 Tax=Pseudomonas TaxID=286 RepID=UPI001F42455A|nr:MULTISPECIES: hypothetical protein [Pseudomonas]MCF1252539.1 hypothetical protein [Pseudomonas putida]MDM9590934.1 hypothetical protein [Pseudomonas asiatica]